MKNCHSLFPSNDLLLDYQLNAKLYASYGVFSLKLLTKFVVFRF